VHDAVIALGRALPGHEQAEGVWADISDRDVQAQSGAPYPSKRSIEQPLSGDGPPDQFGMALDEVA
jgi:hypothetical protein